MAVYTLSPVPGQTFLSDTGAIVPGGLIWTYLSGTSTPAPTYTVQDGTIPQPNPIVLDGFGRVPSEIYLPPGTTQKWVFETAAPILGGIQTHGAVIRTYPTVAAVPTSSSNQDVTGTAGENLSAGDMAYLSDGSGGLVAGKWYKTDADFAYASILPEIGLVIADLAANASGTFRLGGQATVAGPLVTGTAYFLSATAGALTATAPANARIVGVADSTTSLILQAIPVPSSLGVVEGRLTLTSATPVTIADVSAATTLYFTPYKGNRIALFDGSQWRTLAFAELSITLVGLTASKPYDVWAYLNAGVVTLELLIWTNTTTRATALALQDGVLVKSGAPTRRYLGTIYINSSGGQSDDTVAKRYVSNAYNRVPRVLRRLETTAQWTYSTLTIRQANGAAANQVEVMVGVAEVRMTLGLHAVSTNNNATVIRAVGIGEDSTTTFMTQAIGGVMTASTSPAALDIMHVIRLSHYPAVGLHVYSWNEISAATPTTTWTGAISPGTGANAVQSGLSGDIDG